jgi:hypothetical protein
MGTTELQKDFQSKLVALVEDFHTQNPDLFIADIQIHSGKMADLRQTLIGISVRIEVQPN